jgi:hypothetical protein
MKGTPMKSKLARALRKWADLIDPRVKPTDGISIRIDVDAQDAIKEVERVEQVVKRVLAGIAACSVSAALKNYEIDCRRRPIK